MVRHLDVRRPVLVAADLRARASGSLVCFFYDHLCFFMFDKRTPAVFLAGSHILYHHMVYLQTARAYGDVVSAILFMAVDLSGIGALSDTKNSKVLFLCAAGHRACRNDRIAVRFAAVIKDPQHGVCAKPLGQ